MPVDVALIPNDCANRHAIVAWLESLQKLPRSPLQSEAEYDQDQSKIRARIWHLRYHCQPVR